MNQNSLRTPSVSLMVECGVLPLGGILYADPAGSFLICLPRRIVMSPLSANQISSTHSAWLCGCPMVMGSNQTGPMPIRVVRPSLPPKSVL